MAENTIIIRVKLVDGVTKVRALIQHPMETGQRKKSTTSSEKIPAHYIREVTCQHNGQTVMTAYWSQGVSENPYFSFKFRGAAIGDSLTISWIDNKDDSDTQEITIK